MYRTNIKTIISNVLLNPNISRKNFTKKTHHPHTRFGQRMARHNIHLQEFALHGWREARSGDGIRQGFKAKPNASSGGLSFPGEGGGAEDGGVGLLELGIYELDLVLPEREDVVVHRTEDRLGEELLASG